MAPGETEGVTRAVGSFGNLTRLGQGGGEGAGWAKRARAGVGFCRVMSGAAVGPVVRIMPPST
jgi:hypothetical protein